MIGSKTANTDDPLLNVRLWSGHNPVKMILTGKTDLRQNLLILSDPETIVFSRQEKPLMAAAQTHTIKQADMLSGCLDYMAVSGYHSLLVEGGAAVLNSFINAGLWNEIHVIKSPTMLASGIPAPQLPLEAEEEQLLGKDKLSIFRNVL
jgi:diaminohydroxyphosphoribosylaminopyrimidine deaminase/5-amino-6-(5-phosphoribosylamino)uracil reductase